MVRDDPFTREVSRVPGDTSLGHVCPVEMKSTLILIDARCESTVGGWKTVGVEFYPGGLSLDL